MFGAPFLPVPPRVLAGDNDGGGDRQVPAQIPLQAGHPLCQVEGLSYGSGGSWPGSDPREKERGSVREENRIRIRPNRFLPEFFFQHKSLYEKEINIIFIILGNKCWKKNYRLSNDFRRILVLDGRIGFGSNHFRIRIQPFSNYWTGADPAGSGSATLV